MAESLLVALVAVVGFVVFVATNAQGKARAFENGDGEPVGHRPPESVTSVDLPSPQFNQRDPDNRRGKFT